MVSGFLAVYLVGLVVGNSKVAMLARIGGFQSGLATLAEIIMFLTLGLLVFLVAPAADRGGGAAADAVSDGGGASGERVCRAGVLIARRAGEGVCLVGGAARRGADRVGDFSRCWRASGTRGEVFDVVFFVVLASVLLQGTTISLVARWLGVTRTEDGRWGDDKG